MVLGLTFQVRSEVVVALAAAALMILTRCCSPTVARRSLDWQVLLVIAASIGLGAAMQKTGSAPSHRRARWSRMAGTDPAVVLAVIYGVTMVFTEVLSNNTAAVLMFPIALATANSLGVNPMPFIMSITVAASCGFATPIGYQTNLMVYGPGGYRFSDYVRFGGILNLIVWVITVTIAPRVWPF